jgi:hypothetical protein
MASGMMAAAQRPALQLPPRRAAQGDFKKATISRAEGGQLQALVGRLTPWHFTASL